VKTPLLAALALAALGTAACGPDYQRTDIPTTGLIAPQGGNISYQSVVVPEGTVLKAHIVSFDTDGKTMNNQVRSNDSGIMDAVSVISDHDYAFLGIRQGKTTIEIKAADDTVLVLEAVVTPQTE